MMKFILDLRGQNYTVFTDTAEEARKMLLKWDFENNPALYTGGNIQFVSKSEIAPFIIKPNGGVV